MKNVIKRKIIITTLATSLFLGGAAVVDTNDNLLAQPEDTTTQTLEVEHGEIKPAANMAIDFTPILEILLSVGALAVVGTIIGLATSGLGSSNSSDTVEKVNPAPQPENQVESQEVATTVVESAKPVVTSTNIMDSDKVSYGDTPEGVIENITPDPTTTRTVESNLVTQITRTVTPTTTALPKPQEPTNNTNGDNLLVSIDPLKVSEPQEGLSMAAYEKMLFDMINKYRASKGIREIVWDNQLKNSSHNWSRTMAKEYRLYHSNDNVYENVAYNNYATPLSNNGGIFRQWKNSDGHNKNMLSENIVYGAVDIEAAISPVNGRVYYWVTFQGKS